MKKIFKPIFLICLFFSLFSFYSANAYEFEKNSGLSNTAEYTGHSKIAYNEDPTSLIGVIIGVVLGILGVVFLILMMYAGFKWMNARGNEQDVIKAKEILSRAIIGTIVVLSAYAITKFFTGSLFNENVIDRSYSDMNYDERRELFDDAYSNQ